MAPLWLTFLIFAALTVLSEVLRPKPSFENAKPAGLGDFQFPTATEARKIPLIWGTVQIKGPNVGWYGDLYPDPIWETVKTGLWSKTSFIKGYRYRVGIQYAICRGTVDSVDKFWVGKDLLWETATPITHGGTFEVDDPDIFGGDDLGQGGFKGTFEFFGGTTTQTASTYLSTFCQEGGDTPANRGTCYLAPAEKHMYVGNSPNFGAPKFQVRRVTSSDANPLGLTTPEVNDGDANPANVIYEVLTNVEWGMKIAVGSIDETSFEDAADTLLDEGNGFSFILDRPEETGAMLDRLLEQIDGVVYLDHVSGKWTLRLARDDYDLDLATDFTDEAGSANIRSIETYNQGTWEGTANTVSVEYVNREDNYKTTFATAQNAANISIQDGRIIPVGQRFSGVKDAVLADSIAWRLLRTLSHPLARAQVITDRSTYGTKPLDVVKLSFDNGEVSVTDLPMRVNSIDFGNLVDGKITYELVQDVFRAAVGSFGDPGGSGWEPPSDDLEPFPTDEQLAIEAPRMITSRDVTLLDPAVDVVFAVARRQGPEGLFELVGRWASGTPSGDYSYLGSVAGLIKLGELDSNLSIGSAVPLSSLTINSTPSTQADILEAFPEVSGTSEIGSTIRTLIMIGSEFMLPSAASAGSGSDVDFDDVYRGVGDSVQAEHSAGDTVWLLYSGGGISDGFIPPGYNADVKLLPRSMTALLDESLATEISIDFDHRTRRPYAPSEMDLDGVRFKTTVGLESGGSGETDGIVIDFLRRDFRTANEVDSLQTDAETLYPDFPANNTTTHEVEVVNDPAGAATSLYTHDLGSTATGEVPRLEILKATNGVLPTTLQFRLRATHDFEGTSYDSRYDLTWDFTVTSTLTGDFNFGALDTNDISNVYTVDAAGVHTFTLSSAFTTGAFRHRINGGSWVASTTTASLSVSDTIEIQHTSTDVGALKLVTMNSPGGTDAYGVLYV